MIGGQLRHYNAKHTLEPMGVTNFRKRPLLTVINTG
ncbi:hypothetical protein RDI58_006208 [Solanum bulbocastanum]|uniref:Uncharacterized protein n=1 Tax=Solanum bulbocastanum TaxID=147425 RepID=A0AAN8YN70_SOLBU